MNLIADHAPTIALLFFFTAFLAIAWNAYRPGARQRLEGYAAIPLKEDHHG